jgi:hypothetical protein
MRCPWVSVNGKHATMSPGSDPRFDPGFSLELANVQVEGLALVLRCSNNSAEQIGQLAPRGDVELDEGVSEVVLDGLH